MSTQVKNTVFSVLERITIVVCGLILPRVILLHYGSDMNGLVHSVSQCLQFAVIFELGLGAVIPSSMYKPLSERDYGKISEILTSAYHGFRRVAVLVLVYIGILVAIFPFFGKGEFPWRISAIMFVCVGLGSVAHYIAGTPEKLLLISDQKGYLVYILTAAVSLLSTVIGIGLIRLDCSLAVVKLVGSFVSIVSIWITCAYVYKKYPVTNKATYSSEPIMQKWNGVAQHIAYIVLEYTDVLILMLFTSFSTVSVYSVYNMVIIGIKQFFVTISNSIKPKLGDLYARGNLKDLNRFFSRFETCLHLSVVLFFSCTGLLILSFVKVYTDGMTDAQYYQPVFAILLVIAHGFHCLREPYDRLIQAAGHFKETQNHYIVAAVMNLAISVAAVGKWGLPGVAVGTLVSMIYQTMFMAYYTSVKLLERPIWRATVHLFIDIATTAIIVVIAGKIQFQVTDIFSWIVQATAVFIVATLVTAVSGFLMIKLMKPRIED